jgi:hypothetical protein
VVIQLHPRCTGRVLLQSKDPFDYPTMDPNYLCSEYDIKSLIAGTVSLNINYKSNYRLFCTVHSIYKCTNTFLWFFTSLRFSAV